MFAHATFYRLFNSTQRRCLVLIGLLFAAPSHAALSIADAPLSLAAGVAPNILLAIDDSGSMDSEVLMPTNDGALWWHTGDQRFVGRDASDTDQGLSSGIFNVNKAGNSNGTWKKYVYLFPNGTGSGKRVYEDRNDDHFAVPPVERLAFARSPDFNKAYFNPYDRYVPWPSVGSHTYANIVASAAPSDPEYGDFNFDLTSELELDGEDETFKVFDGMPKPGDRGATYGGTNNKALRYYPATFYLVEPLAAEYGYIDAQRAGFAPNGSDRLYHYEIKRDNFASQAQYDAMLQNFANWFSYYRKRHLATRAGVARSLFEVRNARAGYFTINHRNNVSMRSLADAGARESFYGGIYDLGGNSGGTPNLLALLHAGSQFQRTGSGAPITQACQANAAILFTDGYSNYPDRRPPDAFDDIDNEDGGMGAPFEDDVAETLADIAMKFYKGNLRPDLASGQVPVDATCNASPQPKDLACNNNLHMLTYGVTLGARGLLFDPDDPDDPFTTAPVWHTSFENRSPKAVDDLWHAAINGRGELLNADKPIEIGEKLQAAITHIMDSVGSASAIATNSTRLDTDTLIFQARFDSHDWSGQILAYAVGTDGRLGALQWDTHTCRDCLPAAANRNVLTWSNGDGATFIWDSLSERQQALLTTDVAADDVATVGARRVAWLRGDTSREGLDSALRIRSRLLGDIVNSNPYFHWRQNYGFSRINGAEGDTYAAYVEAKSSEPAMLYVGSNDGMLHAFRASDGVEQFAFIPAGVYDQLDELTKPGYTHRYFVDGSPRVLDAYFSSDSAWHSVLVGSTGAGGKSVFAIDVTDPDGVGAGDILWEFSTDMGVAMSDPVIARLASGNWVAMFGNGYDNAGNVKLIVLNLETGALLRAIDTGVAGTDNGLADVVPVDTNGDRVTDLVYAGDLRGNIWKFDLTGSAEDWAVAYNTDAGPQPLFVATDGAGATQPVTGRIAVGKHPDGGQMVYFGTGKYFETSDAQIGEAPQIQTFYGVWDNNTAVTRAGLQAQTITDDDDRALSGTNNSATAAVREVSDNAVDYSSKHGWYLDLILTGETRGDGERVVDQAILRHDRIIFPTLTPSNDPCNFGGTGWLMELDALTGGRLDYAVLDVNGDGVINTADLVANGGTPIPPSGIKFDEMITRPGIIGDGEREYKYTSGSRGRIGVTAERADNAELGRQSWWQLR